MSTELTSCSPMEILTVLETMMEDAVDQFGGVHSVWLDGVADAVKSPNDEQEAIPLVRRLHGLAIKHRCTIVCILHLNPGSDFKSRGHLGSQLEQKAETVLQLKKATVDSGRSVTPPSSPPKRVTGLSPPPWRPVSHGTTRPGCIAALRRRTSPRERPVNARCSRSPLPCGGTIPMRPSPSKKSSHGSSATANAKDWAAREGDFPSEPPRKGYRK